MPRRTLKTFSPSSRLGIIKVLSCDGICDTLLGMKEPRDRKAKGGQGMKWCRHSKRLAIYARDGFACVWCGAGVEQDGVRLTLDHCTPHSTPGSTNAADNLVCACLRCNSSRGKRPLAEFARAAALFLNHGVTPEDILGHIRRCRARKLDLPWAREILSRRSSFSAALLEASEKITR